MGKQTGPNDSESDAIKSAKDRVEQLHDSEYKQFVDRIESAFQMIPCDVDKSLVNDREVFESIGLHAKDIYNSQSKHFDDCIENDIQAMIPYDEVEISDDYEYFVQCSPIMIPYDETEISDDHEFITLERINSFCEKEYANEPKKIIVVVLARFDLDEIKTIVKKHYDYWHYFTGGQLDFFWLGYAFRGEPTSLGNFRDYRGYYSFLDCFLFDNRSFIEDVNRLEKLAGYDFGDEIGLLLFETFNGIVRYDRSLYLNIEALAHQEVDTKLKKFFRALIRSCSEHSRIKEIKNELSTKRLLYSLKDITLTDMLNVVDPAKGLIGAFKIS